MKIVVFEESQFLDFLVEFKTSVIERSLDAGALGDSGLFRVEAFTEVFAEYLVEIHQLSDFELCFMERKHGRVMVRVNAWSVDPDEGQLEIVTTIYRDAFQPSVVSVKDIETAAKQAANLVELARSKSYQTMEPSSPEYAMLHAIDAAWGDLARIRVIVIVDGTAKDGDLAGVQVPGRLVQCDVWDYERLYRALSEGRSYESIPIDVGARIGEPLPCLQYSNAGSDYGCYLTTMPGALLADLYHEYGARLLELNVRSFLQARGKVNKGMRDTIIGAPGRFLAYNNGLSITAEGIKTCIRPDGQLGITEIVGLQVVNGGQTVASIHRARMKDGADLTRIAVQAKITIVAAEQVDELVPAISRFANTQNKVNEADLSANHPFHVRLQQLSETTWTPGERDRWFYERARGQYDVARNRDSATQAKRKEFDRRIPREQRFDKVMLARYSNCWDQLPHVASLGGQKNFAYFMDLLCRRRGADFVPDVGYFKDLVAKAILHKRAERIARKCSFPGYRANAVSYSIALLSHRTAGRLDLARIWSEQDVPTEIAEMIEDWMPRVHEEIVLSAKGRNVTEWCKKDSCWHDLQTVDFEVPAAVQRILKAGESLPTVGSEAGQRGVGLSDSDRENIARTMSHSGNDWMGILELAQRVDFLRVWQMGIATTMATYAIGGWKKIPSAKQAAQAVKIVADAEKNGWRANGLD
jgi:hypothetical protein